MSVSCRVVGYQLVHEGCALLEPFLHAVDFGLIVFINGPPLGIAPHGLGGTDGIAPGLGPELAHDAGTDLFPTCLHLADELAALPHVGEETRHIGVVADVAGRVGAEHRLAIVGEEGVAGAHLSTVEVVAGIEVP